MLAQFGHGLVLVENARTLARDFMGDLALVPECLFGIGRTWGSGQSCWKKSGGNQEGTRAAWRHLCRMIRWEGRGASNSFGAMPQMLALN